MAAFDKVLEAIRSANAIERARQLQILRKAFVPPVGPVVPELKVVLDPIRAANPDERRKQLDLMIEKFVADNPANVDIEVDRKTRGRETLEKFLLEEKAAGRPRPTRDDIETKIRTEARISQRQLDKDLADDYEAAAALGLVKQRA